VRFDNAFFAIYARLFDHNVLKVAKDQCCKIFYALIF
jgi:hypothetical protein